MLRIRLQLLCGIHCQESRSLTKSLNGLLICSPSRTSSLNEQRCIVSFFPRQVVRNGRRSVLPAGPTQLRTQAGSGVLGSKIERVHSLSFWPRSGASSASGLRCHCKIWLRGATGGCVRRYSRFMRSPTRPALGLAWPSTDPTERDVYIARAGGSCWRERAPWLESKHTPCACCPKSVRHPMGPRFAHSRATLACKVPA